MDVWMFFVKAKRLERETDSLSTPNIRAKISCPNDFTTRY
jgi:hypothetical protein